jgi:hypothetical protein
LSSVLTTKGIAFIPIAPMINSLIKLLIIFGFSCQQRIPHPLRFIGNSGNTGNDTYRGSYILKKTTTNKGRPK